MEGDVSGPLIHRLPLGQACRSPGNQRNHKVGVGGHRQRAPKSEPSHGPHRRRGSPQTSLQIPPKATPPKVAKYKLHVQFLAYPCLLHSYSFYKAKLSRRGVSCERPTTLCTVTSRRRPFAIESQHQGVWQLLRGLGFTSSFPPSLGFQELSRGTLVSPLPKVGLVYPIAITWCLSYSLFF